MSPETLRREAKELGDAAGDDLLRHRLAEALRLLDQPQDEGLAELRQSLGAEAFRVVRAPAAHGPDAALPSLTAFLPALVRWGVRVRGAVGTEPLVGFLARRLTVGTDPERGGARRLLVGMADRLGP